MDFRAETKIMRCTVSFLLFASAVASGPLAVAEHRVALLIGVDEYEDDRLQPSEVDLSGLAKSLESRGFRCEIERNPNGEELRAIVDRFATAAPTHGTALVYFAGEVRPGKFKNDSGPFLVGTDGRADKEQDIGKGGGFALGVLDQLARQGGSTINLLLVDAVDDWGDSKATEKYEAPEGGLIADVETGSLLEALENDSDLLADIRAASTWSASTLSSAVALTGEGDRAVAGPAEFAEGKKAGDEWVDGRGIVFCWCPPGTYVAGSPEEEAGRYPDEKLHEVTIEHGFWIAKYEMTLRENVRNRPRNTLAEQKNEPLTMINHDDARRMTTVTMTESERKAGRLPEGWQYSLPTPEQWEYAARAGTRTAYSFGDDVDDLPRYANFGDKSYYETGSVFSNSAHRTLDDGAVHPVEVGSYEPNPWGLHDVHGNVAEWCLDQSIRGGSWVSPPAYCRSAHRDAFSSRNEQTFIGYRLVIQRVPPQKPKK